jgi:tRNA threonylcarbamoyladenosine biosynthesis protein TsaE
MDSKEFITRSEEETFHLAERLGAAMVGGEVVLLEGELGAGKTIFAKGLASGLGLNDRGQVVSPSYTLVNVYEARVPIFHIDLYRIESEEEIDDLGWEDYLGGGVVIVEWADRMPPLEGAIRVFIFIDEDDSRRITIRAPHIPL